MRFNFVRQIFSMRLQVRFIFIDIFEDWKYFIWTENEMKIGIKIRVQAICFAGCVNLNMFFDYFQFLCLFSYGETERKIDNAAQR